MKVLHEMVEARGVPCLTTELDGTPTHLKKRKTVILRQLPAVQAEADSVICLQLPSNGSSDGRVYADEPCEIDEGGRRPGGSPMPPARS